VPLDVVPGSFNARLFSANHPRRADLGIQVNVHLVLEDGDFLLGKPAQQAFDSAEFGVVLRIARPEHRPRTTPSETQLVQPAADGLATQAKAVLLVQLSRKQFAGPTTAEVSEVARCLVHHPASDNDLPKRNRNVFGRLGQCRWQSALQEATFNRHHQVAAGVVDLHDLTIRTFVRQKQQDVGPTRHSRISGAAVNLQSPFAFPSRQPNTASHGLAPWVR
jgi:hypothetical protein